MTARRLRLAVPALLLPLALLTGCDGGSGGPDDPAAGSTPSETSPSSGDSTPDDSTPDASATDAGDMKNPCDAVDQAEIAKLMGLKKVKGIERSTFVVDDDGVLRHEWRGIKVAGHVDEVLKAVKSLKKGA